MNPFDIPPARRAPPPLTAQGAAASAGVDAGAMRHRLSHMAWLPALAVLVLTGIGLVVAERLAADAAQQQALQRLQASADQLADSVATDVASAARELQAVATAAVIVEAADEPRMRAALDRLRSPGSPFAWVGWIDLEGRVRVAAGADGETQSLARRTLFTEGRAEARLAATAWLPGTDGRPQPVVVGGRPAVLELSAPVIDRAGRPIAVLGAYVDSTWLESRRDRLLRGPEKAEARLHVVQVPDARSIVPNQALPPGVDFLHEGSGQVHGSDGGHWLAATHDLAAAGLPWRVVALQERSSALAPARQATAALALLGAAAAFTVAVLGGWLARRQLRHWNGAFDVVAARTACAPPAPAERVESAVRALAAAAPPASGPAALLATLAHDAQALKRALDHLPFGVALVDRELRVEYLNHAYTSLLGWTSDQVRGRSPTEPLLDAIESAEFDLAYARLGDPPSAFAARFEAHTADGRRLPIQWQLIPLIGDAGLTEGGIVIVQDIRTERQARVRADAMTGRLRALAEAAVDDLLATLDIDGRIVEWSRGAEQLSGVRAPEAIGAPLDKILGPAPVAQWLVEALRSGHATIATEQIVADGRRRWFEGSVYALGLSPGAARFGLILRDVTPQRDARRALEQSEARLRLAFEATNMGTLDIDMAQPRPRTVWSEGYAQILGIQPDQLPHTVEQAMNLVHPQDWALLQSAFLRAFHEDIAVDAEFRVVTEGGTRWHALRGRALRSGDGRVQRMIGVGTDVTQRKQAEASLRRERERLERVLDAMTEGLLIAGIDGRFQMANPAAERLLGTTEDDLVGLHYSEVPWRRIPLDNQGSVVFPLERLQAGEGQVDDHRYVVQFADGKRRVVSINARPLHDDAGHLTGMVATLTDITARMAQQRALETTRAELVQLTRRLLQQEKDTTRRLAQALHDELGQTLTALRLHADALLGTDLAHAGPLRERIASLVVAANRQIRHVLGDLRPPLLDEAGLAAALDNERRQQQQAYAPTAELVLQVPPRLQAQRWPSDVEYAAFMVAREALLNALQHADARHIRVIVDGDGGELQLRVEDDGIGLEPERRAGRPGHLGMVGMRERALAIGARLDVASTPGHGTIVTLSWTGEDEPDLPGR